MKITVIENKKTKHIRSANYNYNFNKETGFFARWGATKEDDPQWAPGPEILDIEISAGKCMAGCRFCYKSNNGSLPVKNMTLAQFKNILNKMPNTLTQVAFGITDINTNTDFFPMMDYCREKGIVPNFTCNGWQVTKEVAEKVAATCGAVAVSVYNKDASYGAIKSFADAGMKQINIHFMLSEETYDRAFEIVSDAASDERLKGLNAIVFLAYKPKGPHPDSYHTVKDVAKYQALTTHCEEKGVSYGMDSCSAGMYIKSIQDRPDKQKLSLFVESCESSMFSGYINVEGKYYHCSFSEGEGLWKDGLDVLACTDFMKEVWEHPLTVKFRKLSVKSADKNPYKDCGDCRSCLVFPSINPW